MRILFSPLTLSLLLFVMLLHDSAQAQSMDLHATPSLQGFTGLLNIPNASVTAEGQIDTLVSNQVESEWRNWTKSQDNYIFSIGFFPFAEIGGRLSEAPVQEPDLSANVKITLSPLTRSFGYLPAIAFGIQDLGGGAALHQTKYLVASQEFWRFRCSLGYGFGPDRMDGLFGGVELKAHDWIYLVAEHDTRETNLGIKLLSPELPLLPARINLIAKSSLDYRPGNIDIGIGLQLPLSLRPTDNKVAPPLSSSPETVPHSEDDAGKLHGSQQGESPPDTAVEQMQLIHRLLSEEGFQDVTVGSLRRDTLILGYENNRYLHNELDALGVLFGVVRDYSPSAIKQVTVQIRKKGITVATVSTDRREIDRILSGRESSDGKLRLSYAESAEKPDTVVTGESLTPYLKPTLIFWPGLQTFVGTEVGVFDYSLSLKSELQLTSWKGGIADIRWNTPLVWSTNFDDSKAFRRSRSPNELDRAMFFQTVKLTPSIAVMAGGGMLYNNLFGTLNELLWISDSGNHRVRFKHSYAIGDAGQERHEVYLASYRHYLARQDVSLEVTGGRFWGRDTGFTAELKRSFEDTVCSLYYKNTYDSAGRNWQAAGIQLSFPLTFRRDMKPTSVQVRGIEDWRYSQETTMLTDNNSNELPGIPLGANPQPSVNLETIYFNRDRLSEEYLNSHPGRIKEAYDRYGLRKK